MSKDHLGCDAVIHLLLFTISTTVGCGPAPGCVPAPDCCLLLGAPPATVECGLALGLEPAPDCCLVSIDTEAPMMSGIVDTGSLKPAGGPVNDALDGTQDSTDYPQFAAAGGRVVCAPPQEEMISALIIGSKPWSVHVRPSVVRTL